VGYRDLAYASKYDLLTALTSVFMTKAMEEIHILMDHTHEEISILIPMNSMTVKKKKKKMMMMMMMMK